MIVGMGAVNASAMIPRVGLRAGVGSVGSMIRSAGNRASTDYNMRSGNNGIRMINAVGNGITPGSVLLKMRSSLNAGQTVVITGVGGPGTVYLKNAVGNGGPHTVNLKNNRINLTGYTSYSNTYKN